MDIDYKATTNTKQNRRNVNKKIRLVIYLSDGILDYYFVKSQNDSTLLENKSDNL